MLTGRVHVAGRDYTPAILSDKLNLATIKCGDELFLPLRIPIEDVGGAFGDAQRRLSV